MLLKTLAATEIAQLLAHHPTPEQIVAFHPSSEVAERAYELIQTERDGSASGRATVALLHLNEAERVAYRLGLIDLGHYPTR